jgi:uncharacterized protein YbjT (DUF2867 family)
VDGQFATGNFGLSWVSFRNVAEFAVEALEKPSARNRLIELGGPQPLSPLEAVRIFERESGKKFEVKHVPEEALRQQHSAAPDPLQKSFAALMLDYAGGDNVSMTEVLREFPVKLTSVEEYARAVTAPDPKK